MDSSSRDSAPGGVAAVRRVDYSGDGLVESDVAASPYLQARSWVDAAVAAAEDRDDVPEPTALSVATVDATGTPDVRTVLMRFLDERGPGLRHQPRLGQEPSTCRPTRGSRRPLTWPALYRAIRFRGTAELIGRDEVEAYFDSRPYGSRLSAWASDQSRPAADRHELERRWQEVARALPRHRQRRRRAGARLLGRLAHRVRRGRVLGRAAQPPARPHRLPPHGRRRPRRRRARGRGCASSPDVPPTTPDTEQGSPTSRTALLHPWCGWGRG